MMFPQSNSLRRTTAEMVMRAGGRKTPPPQSFPLGRRLRRKRVHGMDEAALRLRMTAERSLVLIDMFS